MVNMFFFMCLTAAQCGEPVKVASIYGVPGQTRDSVMGLCSISREAMAPIMQQAMLTLPDLPEGTFGVLRCE